MQRLAELCVRRPVLSRVITLVMVVLGIFSFLRLNVSRYPDVELPIITVVTQLPGASPEEVETDVTRRIEDGLSGIDGIDKITSTSAGGFSIVVAQFVLEKNATVAMQEVQDKLGAISGLPAGTAPPQVLRFDPSQIPVAVLALSANRPVRDISEYAARVIAPRLEGILGVAQVKLVGDTLRQINVQVDPTRLAAAGATSADVMNALATPAGNIDAGAQRFLPRTFGRLSDLANIGIPARGGRPVSLGNIARIEDGAAEPSTTANVNGTPAVLLYLQKQTGANTINVVANVQDRLRSLQPTLPSGYTLRVAWDQSEYVLTSTRAVEEHLVVGSLLAALVVLFFLWDWRATIIAALAIPISLISTFTLLAALHLTLNTFTLLALALVIGIVIDDAIVVLENIYRFIHEQRMPAFQAAIEGTREVGPAVMATTLSLIVVFLPLAFMSGIVGRFMSSFGWTMAFAIAVSLLVSFTLTPSLASRWLGRPGDPSPGSARVDTPKRLKRVMDHGYRWLLEHSLRRRWVLVVLSILALASIVPLGGLVNQDFLPTDDESQFAVAIQAPASWTLETTSTLATQIATEIRRHPGVAFTIVTTGDDPQHSPNRSTIFVRMVPIQARTISQQREMARVRTEILPKHRSPGMTALVNAVSDLTGGAAPLQYVVSGPDLTVLNRAAEAGAAYLRTLPGVVDVRASLSLGKSVDLKVSPARAAALGVSVSEAANALALIEQGGDARQVKYAEGGQFYNVHIREDVPGRADPAALLRVPLLSSTGGRVPLGQVIDIRQTTGASEIERFNRERQVTISANLLPEASLGSVVERLDAKMRSLALPPAYHLSLTGISEQVSKTKNAFMQTFTMAFVFMFLVLAAQFESWVHPITILLSLPLTVPFALISMLFLRGSLNPLSYLGILVLFGVVKKNAILQVDRTNQLRAGGMDRHAAIVTASLDRLRPILMTTIAFVAGAIPLALSRGAGATTNHAISTVIIGGQVLSLLLTLAAIPVIYTVFDDLGRIGIKHWFSGNIGNPRRARTVSEDAAPSRRKQHGPT
ncbi:MAG TPA: efflux RND transporter permease subunit [bacterium]|nr:efflux RND transporter permease subunit [bacterium]